MRYFESNHCAKMKVASRLKVLTCVSVSEETALDWIQDRMLAQPEACNAFLDEDN